MSSFRRPIYINKSAAEASCTVTDNELTRKFHASLPNYRHSPLISLPDVAKELSVKAVFVKDESNRLSLPSFKILGASWGVFRAVASKLSLPLDTPFSELSVAARDAGIALFAATDGNHGRAVAWMSSLLSVKAHIFVPQTMDEYTKSRISDEGGKVVQTSADYDVAVKIAAEAAASTKNGLLIQDTSFEGYEEIPAWIVEGYSTMLSEIDVQLNDADLRVSVVVTPVGVGSLADAVVSHCKSRGDCISVVTVEPDTAACLHKSLCSQCPKSVRTSRTIMSGMECGTVSHTAWPHLKKLVDVSLTISDYESHCATQRLNASGITAGPCGGAGLAALLRLTTSERASCQLNREAVVVILSTEGSRPYEIPLDVSSEDPATLTQFLTQIESSKHASSTSKSTGEAATTDFIEAWLEHRGIETHRLEVAPGRSSIVGIVRGRGDAEPSTVNGHVDIVRLAGYVDDLLSDVPSSQNNQTKVVHRSTLDDKAGIVVGMIALLDAKKLPVPSTGGVILAVVADE